MIGQPKMFDRVGILCEPRKYGTVIGYALCVEQGKSELYAVIKLDEPEMLESRASYISRMIAHPDSLFLMTDEDKE